MGRNDFAHDLRPTADLCSLLRPPCDVSMAGLDPNATPGYPQRHKKEATLLTDTIGPELSDWQEKLYASSKNPDEPTRSILVILQGLDTAGKGGIIRHVFSLMDPQGIKLHAFKQPTQEELSHDFLWRIARQLPTPGMIGIFDRSQYEDVLVVRVDELVPQSVWEERFDQINQFEAEVVQSGTTIIKCFLHISADEQKARLLERVQNPTKHWKYSSNDVKVRAKWDHYMQAYTDVLNRCNTDIAPWYVIPSNRKWYRNWAVANLLLAHLVKMNPSWPQAQFNIAEEIARVEESLSVALN